MNRTPRSDRQLYPADTGGQGGVRHGLEVYWLEVDGATPGRDEYLKLGNRAKILAALTMIDARLDSDRPVPTIFMEQFTWMNVKLIEIKAPQRGTNITRLLAYRSSHWELFAAFVRQKKSHSLPDSWKTTAASRVKKALAEGGEL